MALKVLAGSSVPVPTLLAHHGSASVEQLALTLMTCMPGKMHDALATPSHGKLKAAARMLAHIHAQPIDTRHGIWPRFRPHYHNQITRISLPLWASNASAWRDAIEIFRAECTDQVPSDDDVVLHRDYHLGNLLWQGESVSAVLDWISSCIGPRAVDVAHCRWNLCRFHGHEVCDIFTDAYGIAIPKLDRMDVVACVGGLPDLRDLTREQAERIESFLMQSLPNC
jgi:Ser/Thr protein kinase RdoA (MazF antagonist)